MVDLSALVGGGGEGGHGGEGEGSDGGEGFVDCGLEAFFIFALLALGHD